MPQLTLAQSAQRSTKRLEAWHVWDRNSHTVVFSNKEGALKHITQVVRVVSMAAAVSLLIGDDVCDKRDSNALCPEDANATGDVGRMSTMRQCRSSWIPSSPVFGEREK